MLRGELSPGALFFGRMRSWSYAPPALALAPGYDFYLYTHPLRRPEAWDRLYQRCVAALEAARSTAAAG